MLQEIDIEGFKSYRRATLPLAPLTVLVGANASGKSNAIEALRLLSWIAQGNRLNAIRYAVYEGDQAVRGTVANLGRHGERRFGFGCRTAETEWDRFHIALELGDDDDLHIADERIEGRASKVPLYQVVGRSEGAGSDLRVAYNNFARGGHKPQLTCNDHMAVFQQLQSSARFESGHRTAQTTIPEICGRYGDWLAAMLFLDPQPAAMRRYSFKSEHRLLGDGSNLSGVLFNLCADTEDRENVLAFIRSLPEQDINDIKFVETPRGEVMVVLEETFGGLQYEFDATLLSDGTLRVLSIAAALLSAPSGSLVVIEEIDNGVHPGRAGILLEGISRIAKARRLRVLLSSHNPALLDALPDDAVPDVVFCYRNPEDGDSRLVRLSDVPDYPELVAQGTVGHLLTRGVIDRFVKTHRGSAKRREKALAWLQSLQSGIGSE